jgi:hypothetical protein
MHGVIFVELKKYVDTKVGADAWRPLVDKAGVPNKMYMAMRSYDDAELFSLVQTASTMTGTPAPVLLRDFGAFIVPDLLKMYRAFMRPEWKTLDVLQYTETHVHTQVRAMTKGAMPPFLTCTRTSPTEVRIQYQSARKLCPVAEGIIDGIAANFNEKVSIGHDTCMLRGAKECDLRVKLA